MTLFPYTLHRAELLCTLCSPPVFEEPNIRLSLGAVKTMQSQNWSIKNIIIYWINIQINMSFIKSMLRFHSLLRHFIASYLKHTHTHMRYTHGSYFSQE